MIFLPAFGLGFAGSLHCAGMCGPIAMAVPVGGGSAMHKLGAYTIYHIGRISGYAILGFLFGVLGYGFSTTGFQQGLSIFAGVVMLVLIWLPKLGSKVLPSNPFGGFQSRVKQAMAARLQSNRAGALLGLGFFNALLPCGLVYLALAGALASYDPWSGALFMVFFGLGTAPTLMVVAYTGQRLGATFRSQFKRFSAVIATAVAIIFILRGLGLGIPYISPEIGHVVAPTEVCDP